MEKRSWRVDDRRGGDDGICVSPAEGCGWS